MGVATDSNGGPESTRLSGIEDRGMNDGPRKRVPALFVSKRLSFVYLLRVTKTLLTRL
jgi:hypothetical protein